ncbi:MAG: T9SS type A sorting domain-containing protein [Bacteroidota bacterium]
MKKKITRLYYFFWAMLAGYLLLSFSSNPPNGYTGSPPANNTCSSAAGGCHSGGGGTGFVTIDGLPANIDPSTTYPITVTITRTNATPIQGGFQMDVLDDNNSNFGTLSNPGPSSTVSNDFFEHSPALGFSGNTITYTVDWTSPASGNTTVTMYAASVLGNGAGAGGDAVVTTTSSGMMMGGSGQITVDVSGTNVSCNGGNDGIATATASGGGGGPYTYNWSNGASGPTIVGLVAGTYTVTATNAGGTPGVGMVTITEPASAVQATILNVIDINCINAVGTITADGSGGTPGYFYDWSNGATGSTINVASGGTYTVTVSDVNGCTDITAADVEEDTTPPVADAGPDVELTCANPTATLDGSGSSSGPNIAYEWTTSDGNIVSGANTNMPVVDEPGTYITTVIDLVNGCTASDETVVTNNSVLPVAQVAPPANIDCLNSSVELDGTGSSTGPDIEYQWTTANGNIVSGATTLIATVDAAGDYTLTVTDVSNGCTASITVTVEEDILLPTADAGPDMALNCNNTSVALDGSGSSAGANISYSWTTTDGNIVSGATTTMPTVDAVGTYVIEVTNNDNGCFATDAVVVTQTPALMASTTVLNDVACNGDDDGSATANASGGSSPYTYNWSNGETTQTIDNLTAGTYTVTITDADNCTATATADITEPDALDVTVSTTDESSPGASDGSATADVTGGTTPYTYLWNTNEMTQTIEDLAAGTYSVTVTDSNGCTVYASGMVNNFDCSSFSASAITTDVTCFGFSDGTATVTPAGGMMPYGYAWSDGQTTQTALNLAAGSYMVTVLEGNGCMEVLTVTISGPDSIVVSATSVTPVSCNGGEDGEIIVTAAGGSGSFGYLWSNGGMGDTLQNLVADDYTVTVIDSEGCSSTLTVSVDEPTAVNVSGVSVTNVSCHGDSTGAVTVAASGGTPNYTYAWSDGGTGPSRTNLPANNYTVTATDANSCTGTLQVSITQPSAIVPNVTSTDESFFGANDGTASAMPTGGVGGYIYEWNTGQTTAMISDLPPGTYCVTISDLNSCIVEECTTVNSFACSGVTGTASGSSVSCFGGNDGTATVTVSFMEPPLTFLWSNDSTTMDINDLAPGSYSVTVTDFFGCTVTDTYEVTEPDAIAVASTITNASCDDSSDGSIFATVSGGTPPYTVEWSTGDMGPELDSLPAGNYSISIVDANDCMFTENFEVDVDPDTELPNVVLQDITVELDTNGMASITPDMLDNGTTDNCGIDTFIIDISTFTCDDIGENEVVVAVQDLANNCGSGTATVTVVDNLPPVITCPDDITVQSTDCDEVVDYNDPTGTDNCGQPNLLLVSGPDTGAAFPSGITTVTWEAMDASGNVDSCSFNVTVEGGFSAEANAVAVTCNGFEDGTATADPMGGVGPFTYLWDDVAGQMTETATGLSPGLYTVTITDADGCTSVATTEVEEPLPITIDVDGIVADTSGNMIGAIDVTVNGGTGGYTFEWTLNGAFFSSDEDLSGLASGDYVLSVTDENDCTELTDTLTVDEVNQTFDPTLEQFVDLYPNPATEKIFLSFALPATSEVLVDVYDLNGQLVLPATPGYFSNKTMELGVNEFATGIYIVKIVVDDGVLVKRVVIGE